MHLKLSSNEVSLTTWKSQITFASNTLDFTKRPNLCIPQKLQFKLVLNNQSWQPRSCNNNVFTLNLNPCSIKQLICQVAILSIEFEDIDLNDRKAKNVPVINYLRGGPVVDLWAGWLESNYRLNFHFIATFSWKFWIINYKSKVKNYK